MKAFKCDRCGNYYDKFTCNEDDLYIVHANKSTIDLCPECNDELSKWYKNEPVQEDIPDCNYCRYCKWTGSPESLGKCKTCIRGSNFEVSEAFVHMWHKAESEDK